MTKISHLEANKKKKCRGIFKRNNSELRFINFRTLLYGMVTVVIAAPRRNNGSRQSRFSDCTQISNQKTQSQISEKAKRSGREKASRIQVQRKKRFEIKQSKVLN